MNAEIEKHAKRQVLNKSFARRIGKALSPSRKKLLDEVLPHKTYSREILNHPPSPRLRRDSVQGDTISVISDPSGVIPDPDPESKATNVTYKSLNLEIGYGMGEHFIHQLSTRPDELFLGAEVYLNGVSEVIKNAQEQGLNNYLLWPDDIDDMLSELDDGLLDNIYILFPDPWPKRKQNKKRLVNQIRLQRFKSKLKRGGALNFATDISDYFDEVLELVKKDPGLNLVSDDFSNPHEGYIVTKYNKKAIREGRESQFLQAKNASLG